MRILFILLVFSIFACSNKEEKIPKGILSQNEMRKLIWDLMRADVYVADFIMKDSSRDKKAESVLLYEEIFRIHSTTSETFEKSIAYYQSRPDKLKVITDSLRVDERKAMEYQNNTKPQLDTTLRKMKLNRKLTKSQK